MTRKLASNKRRGFTLVELLVVVTIIGTLASIAMPSFQDALDRSRNANLSGNLNVVRTGLESYAADHNGAFPLDPNLANPAAPEAFLQGRYLPGNRLPISPWGRRPQATRIWPMGGVVGAEVLQDNGVLPSAGQSFTPVRAGRVKDPPSAAGDYGGLGWDMDGGGDDTDRTVYVMVAIGKHRNEAIVGGAISNVGGR